MNCGNLSLAITVSWMLLSCLVSSQISGCRTGWFGSKCQFKCLCPDSLCNNRNGQCLSGAPCVDGWFGPSCQFANLAHLAQMYDADDKSSRTYMLDASYPFTWLRIKVKNPEYLHSFNIEFNYTLSCLNAQNATVDEFTLDIHCEQKQNVQFVTLSGPGVQFLDKVYISGGRNVALLQSTIQSSTYLTHDSSKAVDGDTSGDFTPTQCSSTNVESLSNTPEWIVTFAQPQIAHRYVIYNRNTHQERLRDFTLVSLGKGSEEFRYNVISNRNHPKYTITNPNATQAITEVVIYRKNNQENILTLCEVEVYGDSQCEDGLYGKECEGTCNCAQNASCFVSTGGCPSGCAAGFQGESCSTECSAGKYGENCGQNCSEFCALEYLAGEKLCHHVNGTCDYGCQSGYQGPTCSDKCTSKTYGLGCQFLCSSTCADDGGGYCDHVNGACLQGCIPGYQGFNCTIHCDAGTYGKDCASNCSKFCAQNNGSICNHISGECVDGCQTGYQEPDCVQTCTPGTYGPGCQATCSGTCAQGDGTSCHHVNGTCLHGCKSGYHGLDCASISQTDDNNEGSPVGVIVGAIVGVIVAVLVIIGIIFLLRKRKNTKSEAPVIPVIEAPGVQNVENKSIETISDVGLKTPQSIKRLNPDNADGKTAGRGDHEIYYNTLADTTSTSVSAEEFDEYMAERTRTFFKEQFNAIPDNDEASTTVGLSSENKHKNRYKNICAYDHSRVHLIPNDAKKLGDYINASYIEGFSPDEKFIASQGPTMTILEDFVRMLWEQKVEKVVMLTSLVEDGKQKCERYWPEEDEMTVGEITIKLTTAQVFSDYTIRRLQLLKEGKAAQEVTHFHFTAWPDKNIPTAPWGLVEFEQVVASHPTSKPTVVHCSAGVGRTGTFIALRNVMRQAEETGRLDFFMTVKKLRRDRVNMVQTSEQYAFIHRAAQVAMLCIRAQVTSSDISKRTDELETQTETGETHMETEFKALCALCEDKDDEENNAIYENNQTVLNSGKNRTRFVVPKEIYRARLFLEAKEVSDYINAVCVPSIRKQNQQILTQLPLPATVVDFWRLATQYNVSLIVAFETESKSADETIGDYLPVNEDDTATYSSFKVSMEPGTTGMLWNQRNLSVTVEGNGQIDLQKEYHITHLSCTCDSLNPGSVLAVTEHIRSLRPESDARVLYMCRNGAEYSGLVCVMSLLLDKIDNDHKLTVPLVVGRVRAIRPQVIPTLEQYRLLYQVLQLYCENMTEYTNIAGVMS